MNVFMMQADTIDMSEMVKLIKESCSAPEKEIDKSVNGYQIMISGHYFTEIVDNLFSCIIGNREEIISCILNGDQSIFDEIQEKFGLSVFGYSLVHDKY